MKFMKLILALSILILLIFHVSAGTYQLGSHSVSLNLSVPFNHTNESPMYNADFNKWSYLLRIDPITGGFAVITVDEMSTPDYSSASIKKFAESVLNYYANEGVGSMKYGMTTYQNHDAFEFSYPEQTAWKNGQITNTYPEFRSMRYHLDELTDVMVQTVNTGEVVYTEILDSLNVTRAVGK